MDILQKLAEKHQTWINIVRSFGCDEYTAQDIVQDSYIKIHNWYKPGKDIIYNGDEVNYYFVFKTLRSVYLNYVNKEKKRNPVDIDLIDISVEIPQNANHILKKIDHLHWYDKRIFDYVYVQGYSMLELSKLTKISYHSIKRTCARMRKIISD